MSGKEKNKENNQKKFDLQERLIDYAFRFWLPSPSLVKQVIYLFLTCEIFLFISLSQVYQGVMQ
jgi:hypothetical protein